MKAISPYLSKELKRDYCLIDRLDDLGNVYKYGVFCVFSTFTEDGISCDQTRVLTVKRLITPEQFISEPNIEYDITNISPKEFIDQIYLFNNRSNRKSNNNKIIKRDDLISNVSPYKTSYDRHILDLYYIIVDRLYLSKTPFDVLFETVSVMLNI